MGTETLLRETLEETFSWELMASFVSLSSAPEKAPVVVESKPSLRELPTAMVTLMYFSQS